MSITNKIAVAFLFVINMEKEKAPGEIGTAGRSKPYRIIQHSPKLDAGCLCWCGQKKPRSDVLLLDCRQ